MPHDLQRLDHNAAYPADVGRVCFADEVGIDFPSVRAAVERMRDGFLSGAGDEAPPLDIPVVLTPGEAVRGRELTLTLPVRRTCASCGGRGEVWGDVCVPCRGVGESVECRDVTMAVPPGVRHGSRVRATVSFRQSPPTQIRLQIFVR